MDKLANHILQMSEGKIHEWYNLLAAGEDAGARIRTAAQGAAEQYRAHSLPLPEHVMNALSASVPGPIRCSRTGSMTQPVFEKVYLDRLRERDLETERHFAEYFGNLLRIKLRIRKIPFAVAQDVIQETFVRVLTAVHDDRIEKPESFGAYVNSVCNHVLFEGYRSNSRIRDLGPDSLELSDPNIDLEGMQLTGERRAKVREVLNHLSGRDRNILFALVLECSDKDDVCKELTVSREYLRVLFHRAKVNFRDQYRNEVHDPRVQRLY
ncbi:MAG TPA: sigma-70 family RNA polymerase sigma factor [Candidatus Angelobacter sp.]|nr:sigma-70 family RNA polymerase sigma factor [Candidatus Angelobacter sp.]